MYLKFDPKSILISSFFLFIALGNFPRIIQIPFLNKHVVASELLLYSLSIVFFLPSPKFIKNLSRCTSLQFFLIVIIVSLLVGLYKYGFLITPILYNLRLIIMVTSSSVIGYVFYLKYGVFFGNVLVTYINAYFLASLISLLILFLFPQSDELWKELTSFGVNFLGDPHNNRLVSVYFDPNYFSNIIVLPIFFSLVSFLLTGKIWYLLSFIFFIVSLILTGSRSGLGIFVLQFFSTLAIIFRLKYLPKQFLSRLNYTTLLSILFLLICFPIYKQSFFSTLLRFTGMHNDGSTHMRIDSFIFGLKMLKENIFLGMGYNFMQPYTEEFRGHASVDSSVLNVLVSLGVPLFIFSIVWFFLAFKNALSRLFSTEITQEFRLFFLVFMAYVILSILFSSLFNNILFYQFWVVPVISLLTYFFFATNAITQKNQKIHCKNQAKATTISP